MRKGAAVLVSLFLALTLSAQEFHFELDRLPQDMTVRAVEAWNADVFWMGGDEFRVASTYDGGRTWRVDTLVPPGEIAEPLQYRSIEMLDDSTVLALSAGSPAVLWRTEDAGQNWSIAWREDDPKAFMDALRFSSKGYGWMFGDAFDGVLAIYRSIDRGASWSRIDPELLPAALSGEGGFAASDQLIAFGKGCTYFATGGINNRLIRTCDQGVSWDAVSTPMPQGLEMGGPMGLTLTDSVGFMVGGNWAEPEANIQSMARTYDGGETWVNFMPSSNPGHRTGVVMHRAVGTNPALIVAGRSGVDILFDGEWSSVTERGFYTVVPVPGTSRYLLTGKGIWAVLEWY